MSEFSGQLSDKVQYKVNILIGFFVAGLICSNLFGSKISTIFNIDFSVGLIAFPITFLITDIVGEVCGKQKAKQVVYVGLISMIFVLILTSLTILMPVAERSYVSQIEYSKVFGLSIRMQIASITAFFLSQMHDVWAFHFWKKRTQGKFLWIRNNFSTIISQLIDSVVFMFIALWHFPLPEDRYIPLIQNTSDKFSIEYIFILLIPWWILKAIIAFVDTPFVYLGVKWLKGKTPKDSGVVAIPDNE